MLQPQFLRVLQTPPSPHGCLMLTDHIMIMINVQLKVELKGGVDDIREVQ
jgi:hypothetical protein